MPSKVVIANIPEMQPAYKADSMLQRFLKKLSNLTDQQRYWKTKLTTSEQELNELKSMISMAEAGINLANARLAELKPKASDARTAISQRRRIIYDKEYEKRHKKLRKQLGLPTKTHTK
jgi:chromosome segregation ATPase